MIKVFKAQGRRRNEKIRGRGRKGKRGGKRRKQSFDNYILETNNHNFT